MSNRVTVVDYGIGNLFSVQRALETVGAEVRVSGDPRDVEIADRLVLPGVGAFADGMKGLRDRGLVDAVLTFAATQRPLLGICLGMQMFASSSLEFGNHAGLAIIPGRVEAIPSLSGAGEPLKIPNVGWRGLRAGGTEWSRTSLAGTRHGEAVYLVHSFHLVPDNPVNVLATYEHGGHAVTAAVVRDNVIGCQFHPEKSASVGLAILSRFACS
jgi:imidazole glycerol-phosphate synthase subunit HisH